MNNTDILKNKTRQHWHLFWQTPRHNQEWETVSGLGISVCHLDLHFFSFFKSQPALSSPARHSQANHSHLQSSCFVPCPESVRNSVGSERIKSSFSEQLLTSLIPWAVCKGPFQSPHPVPGTECCTRWCKNPSAWTVSSTSPGCSAGRSCRWKGSLAEQLQSIYHHTLAVVCLWNWRFTFWSLAAGFTNLHKNHKSADSKVPLLQISCPHFRLETYFSTSN